MHKCGNVSKQKRGLATCYKKSQIHGTGAGAKGKWFYSGVAQPRRIVDCCFKDPLPFLLEPEVLIGTERGGLLI